MVSGMKDAIGDMWANGERQYVLVQFLDSMNKKQYLFEALPYSVGEGDIVLCETLLGERYGIALGVFEGKENNDYVKAVMLLTGAKAPLSRIVGRATIWKLEYEKEAEDEQSETDAD